MTTPTSPATDPATRYLRPGWFTQHVVNRPARRLARWGVAPKGLRQLAVRGRRSGEWRSVVVNLLEIEGGRYLMAPRGETEWVRNIRVAGGGELRLGRTVEAVRVSELDDTDKAPVLREYLRRWHGEVKAFFPGVDPKASDAQMDEQLRTMAPGFPVFRID